MDDDGYGGMAVVVYALFSALLVAALVATLTIMAWGG